MATIGFVGTGDMGSRMARRLLDHGHAVVAWNRTRSKLEPLTAAGARAAETPAAAADGADAVITMVRDAAALKEVVDGPDGIAAGLGEATLIEMSTVGPPAIARLAEQLGPDRLLDAPVLGSLSEVEGGTLSVFVGGRPELVDRWRPVLAVLGTVIPVGPVGSGAAAKLVANSTLFATASAVAEALALADGLGLSQEAAFSVLGVTPLAAQAERRREAVETGRFPRRFPMGLARKDAHLIADTGLDLRVAAAARSWIDEAADAGWSDRDYSEVLAWILGRR